MIRYKPSTDAEEARRAEWLKQKMKQIEIDFENCLGSYSKLQFNDGTAFFATPIKRGKKYYLRLDLDATLGNRGGKRISIEIKNYDDFLHSLRKIHIPVVV